MKHPSRKKFFFLAPLGIAAFLGVFTYVVYALWNGVLTDVLGVKTITYWQALGLLVLSKILFGGFPGRCGPCGGGWRERMMAKRYACLPPEQREQFREEMRRRFGEWLHAWCGPEGESHSERGAGGERGASGTGASGASEKSPRG